MGRGRHQLSGLRRGAAVVRVIAIDGPAGAGKSTVAAALAERLGVARLDTGAMYRAVAFAALRDGIDPRDGARLGALARDLDLEVGGDHAATASDLARRDRIDSTRGASPLAVAEGALVIDTTGRSVDDVVGEVMEVLARL